MEGGCLSGHRDEEERAIDWDVAQQNTCKRIPVMESAKKINWDTAAVVDEKLIVRLVFSSSPGLRHHKLSSLDHYWWRLALSSGTVCDWDGWKEEEAVKKKEEEAESPWRKQKKGKEQKKQWEEPIDCTKSWTLLRIFASAYQTRDLCPVVTDFLQAAVSGGNQPTLFSVSRSPSGGEKKSFWSRDARGDGGITRILYFSLHQSLATLPAESSALS